MSSNFDFYNETNKYLKSKYNFISLLGGPHPTFFPDVIKEEGIDYICTGEGEGAFRDFLTNLKKGEDLEHIENISSKVNKNPERGLIQDLDEIPMPDKAIVYDGTELSDIPIKSFMTSRGCPYPCTYCFNQTLKDLYKGKGRYTRAHSPERVVAEINAVREKYPLDFVKFQDDFFGISREWVKDFSRYYAENCGIPFYALLRVDAINEEQIILLKKAGCASISFSVDSSNDRIRSEVIKRRMKIDNREIIDRIKMVRRHGIKVYINFIIGIPTSTIEDELDNIDLALEAGVEYASGSILVPYPGTGIAEYVKEHNITVDNESGNLFTSIQKRSTLNCFTDKEKDIQWNLSMFFPLMVKSRFLRNVLLPIAKTFKPNFVFSYIFAISKSYIMGVQMLQVKLNWTNIKKYALKALNIESGRSLGRKRVFESRVGNSL